MAAYRTVIRIGAAHYDATCRAPDGTVHVEPLRKAKPSRLTEGDYKRMERDRLGRIAEALCVLHDIKGPPTRSAVRAPITTTKAPRRRRAPRKVAPQQQQEARAS